MRKLFTLIASLAVAALYTPQLANAQAAAAKDPAALSAQRHKSGTWDFYSDENYGGEMMRLGVGSYPTLDPKWSKNIGSFQCSGPNK